MEHVLGLGISIDQLISALDKEGEKEVANILQGREDKKKEYKVERGNGDNEDEEHNNENEDGGDD